MPRWLKCILTGLLILFVLVVVMIGLTLTPQVQTYVARRVLTGINKNLAGNISFGTVYVTVSGDVHLTDFVLKDSTGQMLVAMKDLEVALNPLALRRNRLSVRRLVGEGLEANFRYDSTGTNLQRALARRRPAPHAAPDTTRGNPWRIRIGDATIHGAHVTVHSGDSLIFDAKAWDLKGRGRYAGDTLKYEVNMQIPERLNLNTDGTLYLGREFIPLVGHLTVFADTSMVVLLPLPVRTLGVTNLTLSFVSSMDSLKLNADLHASKFGHVTFHGAGIYPMKKLALRGEMTFDSLTPGAMWSDTTNMFLSGNMKFTKAAATGPLDGWDAVIKLNSSRYGQYRLASADLKLKTHDSTAVLTGFIDTGDGRAEVETVMRGFFPADPEVTTKIRLHAINLHRLIPQIPDTLLPISGIIDAQLVTATPNIDLKTLHADVSTALGPVTLGSYSADSLILQAHIRGQQFQVDTVRILKDSLWVGGNASGRLDGAMEYAVQGEVPSVEDLKRILPKSLNLPDTIGGRVVFGLSGTASLARGKFSRLTAQGGLRVDSGVYAVDTVRSAIIRLKSFDLDSMKVVADLDARGVKVSGQTADSILASVNGTLNDVAAAVKLWARADTIALSGAFALRRSSEKTELRIDSLSGKYIDILFATEGENSLSLTGKRLDVSGLTITSNVGVVRAQGTLQRGGQEDFALELSGLQTEKLARIFKLPPTQSTVNLRVQILGPDNDLTGDITLVADSVVLDKQPVADEFSLRATVDKRHTVANGQMTWLGDTTLIFDAELPATVSIEKGLTISRNDSVRGRLQLLKQRLEKFNRYLTGDLQVGGFISADMALGGTVAAPSWAGTFAVDKGAYSDPRNGIRYKDITVTGNLVGDTLRIPEFNITSVGKLKGSGWAVMALPLPSFLHLDLNFNRFQTLDGPTMRIRMSGQLAVDGPLNRLDGTGNVTVDKALYRLSASATKSIEPIDIKAVIAQLGGDTTKPGFSPSKMYETMSHRIAVHLPGDTWVRGQGMNVELTGDMEVDKQRGKIPDLAGEIDINRGTVTFYGHEFQVEGGGSFIRFNGPADNPELDITAIDPRLADRGVDISIRVYGTLKSMRLALAGTSGTDTLTAAQIAQLLTGLNITGELAPGQSRDTTSNAQKIEAAATGAATGQLTGLLGRAAGLDVLRFNPAGQGVNGLSSGTLEVGTYVTSRLFVQVVQPVRAEIGTEQVSVEYRLFRWLNLRAQQVQPGESAFDILMRIDWR